MILMVCIFFSISSKIFQGICVEAFSNIFIIDLIGFGYINTNMILIVLASLVFVAVIALSVLQVKQKLIALAGCVVLLIIFNFANEVMANYSNHGAEVRLFDREKTIEVHKLGRSSFIGLGNETFQEKIGDLLEEEREMVNYLYKRWEEKEYPLVYFQHLHKNRLKIVLQLVSYRINSTSSNRRMHVYHVDYKQISCESQCLQRARSQAIGEEEGYVVFVVDNARKSQDLTHLQEIYEKGNVSIIFQQSLPRFFQLHSISKLTYRFPFSNSYLSKILENHPSKTIQYCSNYRSFDYQFYSSSLSTPLLQLCTRPLPSSPASKCVRRYIKDEKSKVPQSWVKGCLSEQNLQGLVLQNGWVGLKKEYFWSGRVNKTELLPEQEQI